MWHVEKHIDGPMVTTWNDFLHGIATTARSEFTKLAYRRLPCSLSTCNRWDLRLAALDATLLPSGCSFAFWMLEGVVAESTVDLVSSPKLWERLPKVLSPEMVDALLLAPVGPIDRYYLRDRALLAVMYATGCRVSEVVGMKQNDVQLDENYCRCTGKGNKQRLVSLNPVATDAIRKYLLHERPDLVTVACADSGHLFLTPAAG